MPGPDSSSLEAFVSRLQGLSKTEVATPQAQLGQAGPEEAPESSDEPSQQEATAEEATEEASSEEEGISTFEELAEQLGADVDALQDLEIGLKVNGKEHRTKLRDALAQFQIDGATKERLEEAKRYESEVKSRRGELEDSYAEKLSNLEGLMSMTQQVLVGNVDEELKKIESLRADDPQEYFAKRMEIEDRQRAFNDISSKYQQEVSKQLEKVNEELRKDIGKHIPEWKDHATMQNENRQLDEYLLAQGFTTKQIKSVVDPKAVSLLRKAMLYDSAKKTASKLTGKAKSKLKLASASPPDRRPSTLKSRNLQAAKEKLRKTGSLDAFAQFYKQSRST